MKITKGRVMLLTSAVFLLANNGIVRSDDAAFVYEIVPVSLPGGHQVAGSITTNCDNCELGAANIIDYQISVSGPRPFVFMPTIEGSYAGPSGSIGEVVATPTEIIVPTTPDRGYWGLVVLANANGCTNCFGRQVGWSQQTINNVVESKILYFVDYIGGPSPLSDYVRLPFRKMVVATLVPEPSGVTLVTFWGFVWLCCGCRRLSCRV
jgi:hypothetical protein